MKFKLHLTTEEGELLLTENIDTEEASWDTSQTGNCLISEVFDEVKRYEKNQAIELAKVVNREL